MCQNISLELPDNTRELIVLRGHLYSAIKQGWQRIIHGNYWKVINAIDEKLKPRGIIIKSRKYANQNHQEKHNNQAK